MLYKLVFMFVTDEKLKFFNQTGKFYEEIFIVSTVI